MDPEHRKAKAAARAAAVASGVGNRVGRPSKYAEDFPARLLAHMAAGMSFWSFAAEAGVCFQTIAEWADPASLYFKPEFSDARSQGEAALLKFDESVGRSGITGQLTATQTIETVGPDGTKRISRKVPASFSATAWQFIMKNRYPRIYQDRQQVAHTDPDGKPLPNAAANTTVIIGLPANGREAPPSREEGQGE